MEANIREWFQSECHVAQEVIDSKHDTTYYEEVYELNAEFPATVPEGATHVSLYIGRSYNWGPDWDCAEYNFVKAQEKVVTITEWVNVS